MKRFTTKNVSNFIYSTFFLLGLIATTTTLSAQCTNDTIPPLCIAPSDTSLTCIDFKSLGLDPITEAGLAPHFGSPTVSDNCPGATFYGVELIINLPQCGSGTLTRVFTAMDASGNTTSDIQVITIAPSYAFDIHIPADQGVGDPPADTVSITEMGCNLVTVTRDDILMDLNCDGEIDQVIRDWVIRDWCLLDLNDPILIAPRIDVDGDNELGDAHDFRVLNDSVYYWDGTTLGDFLGTLSQGLLYRQIIYYNDVDTSSVAISGKVFLDEVTDCDLGTTEIGLANQIILLDALPSGQSYRTISDASGNYQFQVCSSDTAFNAHLELPFNYAGSCGTSYHFEPSTGIADTTINLPVQLPGGCPQLIVDIGTGGLRPCTSSSYAVSYQNFNLDTISDVSIVVILDPFLDFLGADIPPSSINGDTLTFLIGNLNPLEAGTFYMGVFLDCTTPLGQTHCVQANIYPDTICDPIDPAWSGASIAMQGRCMGDSVEVFLKNVGTNNMPTVQDYVVIEDVLMLSTAPFQLAMGEVKQVKFPANGATWHISTEQIPFHPGRDMPSVTIEGCGGLNIPGQALSFPHNDANPFVSIDCQQNVNSYDPNDKQVFPRGVGEEHYIEANTDLEYLIRFQNTGTAPAIKVVILDTLSEHLDPTTIQSGAASHGYTFEQLEEGRVLRFTFDEIWLPDSVSNEPESHGFVKFRIQQKVDLPLGTQIPNTAAIYFDNNEAVITNSAFVEIGADFIDIAIGTIENLQTNLEVLVYPNPTNRAATIELKGLDMPKGKWRLYNVAHQLIRQELINSSQSELSIKGMAPGMYFLEVEVNGEVAGMTKIAVY